MDLHAYHRALNLGFSESEASRIGDNAWENNRQQPTCDPEPEPDYYDVLVVENTQLRAAITRLRSALTSIYLYQQDIGHPPLHSVAEGMRKMAHDALRAAASSACKPDCRTCQRFNKIVGDCNFGREFCVGGNNYVPTHPLRLYEMQAR